MLAQGPTTSDVIDNELVSFYLLINERTPKHFSDSQHEHEIAFPYPSILHYGRIYQRGSYDPDGIQ